MYKLLQVVNPFKYNLTQTWQTISGAGENESLLKRLLIDVVQLITCISVYRYDMDK